MMLRIRSLSVRLQDQRILDAVSAQFGPGLHAIVGPNGAGKSTLLRAIAGLVACDADEVSWRGENLQSMSARHRAECLAYQAQNPPLHWPVNVAALVCLARVHRTEAPTVTQAAVQHALQVTGMDGFGNRNVRTLSGGERARALLAHTFASGADLLLVDEPVAALDPAWAVSQMKLLREVAQAGKTVLCVLHDMQYLRPFADRVLVLQNGRIIAHDSPQIVLSDGILDRVFAVAFAADGAMVL